MKLEEGCAKIAGWLEIEPERVVESVKMALGRVGWEEGGYEFDDWEVNCRCTDWNKRCDPRRTVIRRFTHDMNNRPLWPDIVNVTKETAGRIRAVCIQRRCKAIRKKKD